MYSELINTLKPIPKLNLTWYKDEDFYSEGDIEDAIIQLIANNPPEDYSDIICQHFSWSTYYHLTHLRKNILNWYPFSKDASVLEIGCGMGAITSVLCDHCKEVTSVELSKRRATATLLRCREKSNLEIIVGNLNDIEFDKKFDYITLIGVLEYQGSYTNTDNPYSDFLKRIKTLLKPNGKLLIAIENQYGLKYWCGAREDHTSIPFDGMNQYTLTSKKVRTFSKSALDELIKLSGYKNTYFYYPMPDYKLPTVVYSQNYLPQNHNMQNFRTYYVPDTSTLIAQEEHIYQDIIDNDVFEFFANSFLVECSDDDNLGCVTFASLSSERTIDHRIGTRFVSDDSVEKFALNALSIEHIAQTSKNEKTLAQRGIRVLKSSFEQNKIISAYSDAPLLEYILLNAFEQKDYDKIYSFLDMVYADILTSSETIAASENILFTLGLDIQKEPLSYGPILKTGYLDMLFRNAFLADDSLQWFDQEWILENIPAKYILYRAIMTFYSSYPKCNTILPLETIATHYQFLNNIADFRMIEELFMGAVIDQNHMAASRVFRDSNRNSCITNIQKLLNT